MRKVPVFLFLTLCLLFTCTLTTSAQQTIFVIKSKNPANPGNSFTIDQLKSESGKDTYRVYIEKYILGEPHFGTILQAVDSVLTLIKRTRADYFIYKRQHWIRNSERGSLELYASKQTDHEKSELLGL